MNTFRIERAGESDFPELFCLQREAYATENALYDTDIPPMTQSEASFIQECRDAVVLKAVVDGCIAGSVRGVLQDGVCRIGRLMVRPSYRGRGLGARLLETIERAFPEASYALFTGDRSRFNIDMYLRHGYRITRTDPETGLVYFRKDGQTETKPSGVS